MRAMKRGNLKLAICVFLIAAAGFVVFFPAERGFWAEKTRSAYNSFFKSANTRIRTATIRYEQYPNATHYFILPQGKYFEYIEFGLNPRTLFQTLLNAIFNFMFQPIFLCLFTPQTVLTYLIFPFFIYGSVVYFRKVPLMIIFFFGFGLYLGMRDSVVESLVRHRMVCDLIYLSIGTAGFTRWITEKS